MTDDVEPRIALLRELAESQRLRVIDRLSQGGPATVSELSAALDAPMPRLSNHLRRLRDAGLVETEQRGRHTLYRLANPDLGRLLQVLDHVTGVVAPARAHPTTESRTCYDHLAGPLGVGVYAALLDRDALRVDGDGDVALGPQAAGVLAALGVDPASLRASRRRLGFECFDATQHRPHLAGLLGDAIAAALFERGWIERRRGRGVQATAAGRRALRRTLQLSV